MAACNFLGQLLSMLNVTVFGMGVIVWKSSHDYRSLVGTRYELTDLIEIALSNVKILICLTI